MKIYIGNRVQIIGLGGQWEGMYGRIIAEAPFKYALNEWKPGWLIRFDNGGEARMHPNWLRKIGDAAANPKRRTKLR